MQLSYTTVKYYNNDVFMQKPIHLFEKLFLDILTILLVNIPSCFQNVEPMALWMVHVSGSWKENSLFQVTLAEIISLISHLDQLRIVYFNFQSKLA